MTTPSSPPKATLEQNLRREVQAVPVGARIPSIRELRTKYSVGQAAVERAISRLTQQGLIEVRPKSGIYRSDPPAGPISLIYRSTHDLAESNGTYYGDFVMHMISELATNGHSVKFVPTVDDQVFTTLVRQINRAHERAITFALKWNDVETIASQVGDSTSFIHVLPNFVEPIANAVVLDDRDIVRLQVEHLVERGHRRIGYLHGYNEKLWSRPAFQRYNAFRDLMMEYRLETRPSDMREVGNKPELTYQAIYEICQSKARPTSFIISGDICVREAYKAIHASGLTPGQDMAVVSVNNRPWCEYVQPGLTSVDISPRRGAQAVSNILKRLEAGETGDTRVLQARLIARASSDFDINK